MEVYPLLDNGMGIKDFVSALSRIKGWSAWRFYNGAILDPMYTLIIYRRQPPRFMIQIRLAQIIIERMDDDKFFDGILKWGSVPDLKWRIQVGSDKYAWRLHRWRRRRDYNNAMRNLGGWQ